MNITRHQFRELQRIADELSALKSGGVESWSGYDSAIKDFDPEIVLDDLRQDLLEDIESALLSGPFSDIITDEGRDKALQILITSGVVFEKLKRNNNNNR